MTVSCDTKVDPCPLKDLASPPAIGSPEWRTVFNRFNDVLERSRRIEPTLMERQPAPATYAELLRQSGILFEESAFLLDTINLRNRWLVEQIALQDRDLKLLTIQNFEIRKRIAALPAEKSAAQLELARARPQNKAQQIPALAIENAANALRERANQAAQDCIYWLAVAEPAGVKPLDESLVSKRLTAQKEPLVWSSVVPESAMVITPTVPARDGFTGAPIRRAQPSGSAFDRLAVAEGLLPQLTDAIEVMRRNEATQARNEVVLSSARAVLPGLLKTLMREQAELNGIRAQMLGQKPANTKELQLNQARALGNLRRAAAETYILEAFRDHVVVPEVRSFLSANRINRALDHASVVRIYAARAKVLPARSSSRLVGLPRLLAIQQQAARVIGDYRTYAGQAALWMGREGNPQVKAFREEVRRTVGVNGVDLLSGSERDSGILAAIVHVLFARDPQR